jgi:hypothetical protein
MPKLATLVLSIMFIGLVARWDRWVTPNDQDAVVAALRKGGCFVLLRHAQTTPGTGDPIGFDLSRRETQRNLSDVGRTQATNIGVALNKLDIPISEVWSSPWYRCRDTAELATGRYTIVAAFGSTFEMDVGDRRAQ